MSPDLWIWHTYFGIPGSHNDTNVLETSVLFRNLWNGEAPKAHPEKPSHKHHQIDQGQMSRS